MIEKYGVDALRFSVFDGVAIQSDSRFSEKKVILTRNFINKIWNASRYVLMQIEGTEVKDISEVTLSKADKWILTELNNIIDSVDKKFEKYDIGMVASDLSDFFWTKFCDWYIELSKCDINENKEGTVATLVYVLTQMLKLLHPFIPFVTEKIYLELPNHDESIMISSWPITRENYDDAMTIQEVMNIIKSIRNIRAEKKVPDNKKINAEILLKDADKYSDCLKYISKLALISDIKVVSSEKDFADNSVGSFVMTGLVNVTLTASGSVEVPVSRLVSKVTLSSVTRAFELAQHQDMEFEVTSAFLTNVPEKIGYFQALQSGQLINEGITEMDAIIAASGELLYDELSVPIAQGASEDIGNFLYCYPNMLDDPEKPAYLVVGTRLGDGVYYYSVELPEMESNKCYNVSLTVTMPGTLTPNTPVEKGNAQFSVVVSDWEENIDVNETI
jgi:valyl-tRNA synthetase